MIASSPITPSTVTMMLFFIDPDNEIRGVEALSRIACFPFGQA
jgi:hypothetical protein